jgi:cardiolipin synthase A/B
MVHFGTAVLLNPIAVPPGLRCIEPSMDGGEFLGGYGQLAVAGLSLLMSILAAGHAVLYRRDPRAAFAWVAFIWIVPLAGAVLYFVFGVNRIRKRAAELRVNRQRHASPKPKHALRADDLGRSLVPDATHLNGLARLVGGVVDRPILPGNSVEPLEDGDEAYPAMLESIRQAEQTLTFGTYIFDRDAIGREFARELGEAVRRGVEVRVLIDAAGTRYSWPSILHSLRRERVPHARFLPAFALWRLMSINMRNHRKVMVADGRIGFTGGLNVRIGHCPKRKPRAPVRDFHYRVQGPVVAQLQEIFADDWLFTTGESLLGPSWFPELDPAGPILARAISDGPDEDLDKLRWAILGALTVARSSVLVQTPYFLPDAAIISALNLAALRGVQVDIVLPAHNNLPFVHWASRAHWWQVLEHGCRIWLTPPPFDHSKLMLVDDAWTLLGSANWDPRSLRLNFELNVEFYNIALAQRLRATLKERLAHAHEVTLAEVDGRSLPARLRDGVARLLTPYL